MRFAVLTAACCLALAPTASFAQDDDDDAAAIAKLSPDQTLELLKKREEVREHTKHAVPAVATVVPVATFLFLAVLILGLAWLNNRKDAQRHVTLRLMVEKGANIPAELLVPPAKKDADLRRGIILMAAGVGLSILLAAVSKGDDHGTWAVGVVPFLIGVAYLVAWRLTREPKTA